MNEETYHPQIIASEVVLNAFIQIRKERLLHRGMVESDHFTISSTPESVAVIAINKNGDILVTQEYRHAIKKTVLGCPGGLVDPGETVLEAAKRELLEETGCTAEKFEVMGRCFPLPGLLDQKMACILATNAQHSCTPQLEATEMIQSFFLSQERLRQKLHQGADIDGILCAALFFWNAKYWK